MPQLLVNQEARLEELPAKLPLPLLRPQLLRQLWPLLAQSLLVSRVDQLEEHHLLPRQLLLLQLLLSWHLLYHCQPQQQLLLLLLLLWLAPVRLLQGNQVAQQGAHPVMLRLLLLLQQL